MKRERGWCERGLNSSHLLKHDEEMLEEKTLLTASGLSEDHLLEKLNTYQIGIRLLFSR